MIDVNSIIRGVIIGTIVLGVFHGSILLMLPFAHKETPLQPDVTSKGKKRGFALELHSQDVSVLSQPLSSIGGNYERQPNNKESSAEHPLEISQANLQR